MIYTAIKLILLMLAIIAVWWFIRWLSSFKGLPDPWEGEVDEEELKNASKPVCLNCQRPVDNPSQYYCPNCGNVTGDYTRYMPFINIPFNYSIYGKIWRSFKSPDTFILIRVGYFFLLLLCAPLMLIAWPFVALFIFFKKIFTFKSNPRDG